MVQKQRVVGRYSYAYDPSYGKQIESVTPATTERFGYDDRARPTSHERLIDENRFTNIYRYDENDRLSRKKLPDGQTLLFHYLEEPGHTRGNLLAITRESVVGQSQETLGGPMPGSKVGIHESRLDLPFSTMNKRNLLMKVGRLPSIVGDC